MHVYADRVVHTIVPVPEAPEVRGFGTDVVPLFEAMSPEERFDMVSRKDSDFNRGAPADTEAATSPPTS